MFPCLMMPFVITILNILFILDPVTPDNEIMVTEDTVNEKTEEKPESQVGKYDSNFEGNPLSSCVDITEEIKEMKPNIPPEILQENFENSRSFSDEGDFKIVIKMPVGPYSEKCIQGLIVNNNFSVCQDETSHYIFLGNRDDVSHGNHDTEEYVTLCNPHGETLAAAAREYFPYLSMDHYEEEENGMVYRRKIFVISQLEYTEENDIPVALGYMENGQFVPVHEYIVEDPENDVIDNEQLEMKYDMVPEEEMSSEIGNDSLIDAEMKPDPEILPEIQITQEAGVSYDAEMSHDEMSHDDGMSHDYGMSPVDLTDCDMPNVAKLFRKFFFRADVGVVNYKYYLKLSVPASNLDELKQVSMYDWQCEKHVEGEERSYKPHSHNMASFIEVDLNTDRHETVAQFPITWYLNDNSGIQFRIGLPKACGGKKLEVDTDLLISSDIQGLGDFLKVVDWSLYPEEHHFKFIDMMKECHVKVIQETTTQTPICKPSEAQSEARVTMVTKATDTSQGMCEAGGIHLEIPDVKGLHISESEPVVRQKTMIRDQALSETRF